MSSPEGREPEVIPDVPDHELLRCIGRGRSGEVWLARSAQGIWHAVKIVWRHAPDDVASFDEKFSQLQRFAPISCLQESIVHVTNVGRNDRLRCFYSVMELSDDERFGRRVNPDRYEPKTLESMFLKDGTLPLDVCIEIGIALTQALGALHQHNIIHGDIKPSNVAYVDGLPKLADIGLGIEPDPDADFTKTEGYEPREGPGTVQADIYSLGKVLYEISTGLERKFYPSLPADAHQRSDHALLLEFHKIVTRACASKPHRRYASAVEMLGDLQRIKEGKTLHWPGLARHAGIALGIMVLLAGGIALKIYELPQWLTLKSDPGGNPIVEQSIPPKTVAREATPDPIIPRTPPKPASTGPAMILEGARMVSGRRFHTLALLQSGRIAAWGLNDRGQLGIGTWRHSLRPVLVGNDTHWSMVEAGESFSIALKTDGTLWSWGRNTDGELGNGQTENSPIPVRVGNDADWLSISVAQKQSFAFKRDGSLWSWGLMGTNQVRSPKLYASPGSWHYVVGSYRHFAGIKPDQTLWTWGGNEHGERGRGIPGPEFEPPAPILPGKWLAVGTGLAHGAALRSDGTLWSWGWNAHNQLGMGDNRDRFAPVQVGGSANWKMLCVCSEHNLGLKADGTLWGWGRGLSGEMGDGSLSDRLMPVQISFDKDWIRLPQVLGNTSFAIKKDGSLWGWGPNTFGQLGDPDQTMQTTPMKILPMSEAQ